MTAPWETIVGELTRAASSAASGRSYDYPDPANALEESVFPLEKRKEELAYWSDLLTRAVGPARPVSGLALDAGCGLGTHTEALAEVFEGLLSIDADPRRLGVAERRLFGRAIDGVPPPGRAFFALSLDAPGLRSPALASTLSLVHCVQVLGHVPRAQSPVILGTFFHLLAPGGALLLAVPMTVASGDEFWVGLGPGRSATTSAATYDQLAGGAPTGVLPVRHFSFPSLRAELTAAGFTIEVEQPYNWFSAQRSDAFVLARKPR